jgi:uncharacterized Zn finger protein
MSAMKRRPGSSWSSWRDRPSGPKPPAPAHGIKIKTVGTTWWGQRWIEALEKMSPEYASRLARGKTYARTGRVHDLVVEAGKVSARVTGSSREPYAITFAIPPLDPAAWSAAIERLATKARFAAELLAGDMPKDVDDAFRAGGVSLFPKRAGELVTTCSCPDWANPCKHVAATHYVLGDAFDRDPFLLFELRGRTQAQVLAATRKARGGDAPAHEAEVVAGVRLPKLRAVDYDAWRGPMPALRVSFTTPQRHAGVIESLGTPAAWREKLSPAELLGGLVQSASTQARQIALSDLEAPDPMKTALPDEDVG